MGLASRWVSGKTGVMSAPPAPRTIRPPPPPLGEENTCSSSISSLPPFSHTTSTPYLGSWLGRPVCRVGHCWLLGVSFPHEPPPGLSFRVCFGAAPLASPCNLDMSHGLYHQPTAVRSDYLSFDLSEHQSVLPSTHPSSPGSSSVTLPQTLYRRLPHNSPNSCIYHHHPPAWRILRFSVLDILTHPLRFNPNITSTETIRLTSRRG